MFARLSGRSCQEGLGSTSDILGVLASHKRRQTFAWLANPNTRVLVDDVPAFLKSMHDAVNGLTSPAAVQPSADDQQEYTPAVSVRKSLAFKDHIISMIDGKPYKTLRRHLSRHDLTPDQYRERYGLKKDYPMVSESYSGARREMAKKIGLGRKSKSARASEASASAPTARSRTRKLKAEAIEA